MGYGWWKSGLHLVWVVVPKFHVVFVWNLDTTPPDPTLSLRSISPQPSFEESCPPGTIMWGKDEGNRWTCLQKMGWMRPREGVRRSGDRWLLSGGVGSDEGDDPTRLTTVVTATSPSLPHFPTSISNSFWWGLFSFYQQTRSTKRWVRKEGKMWRKEWKREEEIVSNRWEDLGGITTAHYPSQLLISCFSFSPFLHVFCGWLFPRRFVYTLINTPVNRLGNHPPNTGYTDPLNQPFPFLPSKAAH